MDYLKNISVLVLGIMVLSPQCAYAESESQMMEIYNAKKDMIESVEPVQKSESEWKSQLSKEQFHVTREQGTERAFSGQYWDHKAHGLYQCVGCGTDLFDSTTKFKSGTGWPSFWAPIHARNVKLNEDRRLGMKRTEVVCARCESHLGHVFDDGPAPTGARYCINSASLRFQPQTEN